MADFRKFMPVLALLALIVVMSTPAAAQPTAFACTASAGVPPLARAEGLTELVGDIVLNCAGGTTSNPIIQANVQIFLNTNVTNRLLSDGITTDALLILGEPPAANISVGTLPVIPPTLTNTYRGNLAGSNSIVWLGVPLLPAGSTSQIVRITNVRANAAGVTTINPNIPSSLIPSQIVAFISISASTSVPVNNPQQIVAFVQPGLVTSAGSGTLRQCFSVNTSTSSSIATPVGLTFTEGFATAFKPRTNSTQGALSSGIATQTGTVGSVNNAESGFLVNGTSIGVADAATRVQAVFENVPAGTTVYVTKTNVSGMSASVSSGTSSSDTSFASTTSGSTTYSGAWRAVTLSGTTGTVVWELSPLDSQAFESNNSVFWVALSYTANPAGNVPSIGSPMTVRMSFSPLSTTNTASTSAAIPRFVDTGVARTIFTINACVSNLLYPFVTSAPGFDTGIAISNTSLDAPVFATSAQTGTCTLYFFGPGAPTTAPVTPTITAGTVFAYSMWAGSGTAIAPLRDFTGYLIARCTFQYAHGYAFVSDLGSSKFAQGYLALVIPDRSSRPADPFSTATTGTGEQLAF